MRILLIGANGQVGWELQRTLPVLGELVTTSRAANTDLRLDAGDLKALRATLDSVAPDVIVNASAYTAVDQAETERPQAMRLNAEVPAVIGEWAGAHRALVIHYSTDYVFDGAKDGPYVETDAPKPVSAYGETKLAGDLALLDGGCDAIVLRVSWVYGLRGRNFLLTIKRLMQEREELRVVDDQFGAPTWCRGIAQATSIVLARLPVDPAARRGRCGLYHLSPAGSTSWFGFAVAIRDLLGIDCLLSPITTPEYPTPASRPRNSRLDAGKLEQAFGVRLPAWERDLRRCLDAD